MVAPATARVIGAYAAGISDDLLTATLLATRAPVVVCPAMHTEMWEHPAVQDNLAVLRRRGVQSWSPRGPAGRRGQGAGRLAEPADIVAAVGRAAGAPADPRPASGPGRVRVLVTAGGTREPIDPVRFIGNRSSGKQGHAIAEEAAARGATVTLVTTTTGRAAGRRGGAGGDGRRDGGRGTARAPAPTSSSWRPRSPTSGRRRRPTAS